MVNGVNAFVWTLAAGLVTRGHRVALLVSDPDEEARAFAKERGITLQARWDGARPDVLHCHSVFIPTQAGLCRSARRKSIPYVITPNGGLAEEVLDRGRLKKRIYSTLIERPRFYGSTAVICVAPGELRQVSAFVPDYRGHVEVIPNAIETAHLNRISWRRREIRERRKVVYLGRFDAHHKGLDLLAAVAAILTETDIHVYGAGVSTFGSAGRPPNILVHGPVYDEEKIAALLDADMYVQMSRWEAFGVSVAEAMALGVPCAISDAMSLAPLFRERDLGLVIPLDPRIAAAMIRAALSDAVSLNSWSASGRVHAHRAFSVDVVAEAYARLYQTCSQTC
jgi:glycosyltransferase involved in cell wall biosynthesis